MKRYLNILYLFLVATTIAVAQPAQRTLIKTMALPGDVTQIVIDVKGDIQVVHWEEKTMRLVTEIQADVPDHILKALTVAGRYNYELIPNAPEAVLTAPNQDRRVLIGGQDLEEEWKVLIFIPNDVDHKLITDEVPM